MTWSVEQFVQGHTLVSARPEIQFQVPLNRKLILLISCIYFKILGISSWRPSPKKKQVVHGEVTAGEEFPWGEERAVEVTKRSRVSDPSCF